MPGKSAVPVKQITLPVLTDAQLKQISEFVLREGAAGLVRSVINIGRYLFAQLFRSSEEAFRSMDRTKPNSLAALAEQPGMAEAAWGRTRLDNAIELSLMAKNHNDFRAWRFLRPSHYEVVFGMPVDQQRELLDQADKEHWSVMDLSKAAKKKKARPTKSAAATNAPGKALTRLHKVEDQFAELVEPATSVDSFLVPAGIDAKRTAKFTAKAKECLDMLEDFRKQLEQMKQANLQKIAGTLTKRR